MEKEGGGLGESIDSLFMSCLEHLHERLRLVLHLSRTFFYACGTADKSWAALAGTKAKGNTPLTASAPFIRGHRSSYDERKSAAAESKCRREYLLLEDDECFARKRTVHCRCLSCANESNYLLDMAQSIMKMWI